MPENTDFIDTHEAAKILGCSISSVARFVRDGSLIPLMRLGGGPGGGAMFFDRADVKALAELRAS